MIKITRTRLTAGVAAAALASGALALTAVTAGASSAGCTGATGALTGSCGDEVNSSVGWAAQTVGARSGSVVVTASATDTDGRTDFYAHETNANANERVFEYAPNGRLSRLCITNQAGSLLILRTCDNRAQQEFYAFGDTQNDTGNANGGVQWMNVGSGNVVTPEGRTGSPLAQTAVDRAASITGSYFHWAG